MTLLLSIIAVFVLTVDAQAQILCSQFSSSTVCSGPSGSTTITELHKNQGVITDSSGRVEPYAVMPNRSQTIQPLQPLPSLQPRSIAPPSLSPAPLGPAPLSVR